MKDDSPHVAPVLPATLQAEGWMRPEYERRSLVNLMSAVAAACGGQVPEAGDAYPPIAELAPEVLAPNGRIVLLVVDGLGSSLLERTHEAGTLRANTRLTLTSVFPSTTASAITTLMTGTGPKQHAQTGWFTWYRELGLVGAPLPFVTRIGQASLSAAGVEPERIFPVPALASRLAVPAHLVQPEHLVDTDYTRAHAGAAARRGFRDLADIVRAVSEVFEEPGPAFVYAYWPELDARAHRFGAGSLEVARHLCEIDDAVLALGQALRDAGATLLVTADHGFVDTTPESRIELADHPALAECLQLPLCGEPRVAYCYLRSGCEARFEDYVGEALSHACVMVSSDALADDGWFGLGAEEPRLRSRIGDRVLLMKGCHSIRQRLLGESTRHVHIGVHGGPSRDEMEVPLVAIGPGFS